MKNIITVAFDEIGRADDIYKYRKIQEYIISKAGSIFKVKVGETNSINEHKGFGNLSDSFPYGSNLDISDNLLTWNNSLPDNEQSQINEQSLLRQPNYKIQIESIKLEDLIITISTLKKVNYTMIFN